MYGEGCPVLIWLMHLDLIVSRVGIHEAEEFMTRCCVDHLVYAGWREAVFGTSPVEVREVDADSSLPILLYQN